MIETRIAKLFKNGASQAVRLPAEFRFAGDEVYVSRDDATGDVVLSSRPGAKTWGEFFELLHAVAVPEDFMPADHHLHLVVRQFLKIVRIAAWDEDAADWYAEIRHQLVSSGQPIGELDMMTAAHALSIGAVLVGNNSRHYERIAAPLILQNWA